MGYISSADQKSLAQRYRATAVAVASFAFSALVLILLPTFLRAETPTTYTFNWPKILAISALLLGLASVLSRRILLSSVVLETAARQGREAVFSRLSTTAVVGAGLGEAVGIAGLIGYFMTGKSFAWPVGAVSIMLIAYSFPRRGEWARALELVAHSTDEVTPAIERTIE